MEKPTLSNIYSYITGTLRYELYYSKYKYLIRKHILEQIDFRISVMDRDCYNNGSCKKCGCKTTALQMCKKACLGDCYPKMLSKRKWNKSKLVMDIWENKELNLGTIKVGEKVKITFKRTSVKSKITSVETGCGCANPTYDKAKEEITILYTAGDVPHHLKDAGMYNTTQLITVKYEDRDPDYLTFRVIIKK